MAEDKDMTDRHTRAVHMLADLEGYEGSELAKSRESAWDYYLQRPRGDEVEGRSPVVSGDISAMVESTLSQVCEALSTDKLAEFEGCNTEDEFQGQLEGAVVSKLIMGGKGWLRLASAVKNALLLRMGVMSVEIVRDEQMTVEVLEGVDAIAKAVLEEQGLTFTSYDEEMMTGTIERMEGMQTFRPRSINPENFLFQQWPLDDFPNIPACAERVVKTRQQLIDEEEIDAAKVDALPMMKAPHKSDDTAHSLRRSQLSHVAVNARQERIEWFVLYYLCDGHRYRAVISNNKVLKEESVSTRPPFVIGVPFINPGRTDGFSTYDKLKSTQDITTALNRMLNDNANAVTMNRLAVLENAANNDQLTDQDPSGVLHIRRSVAGGDIRNAVLPIQTMDLTQGLVLALNYQKSVRAEMAGASLDVGTGQVQLPDRMGSMGLDRAYSASEQLSSLILKTFSETLIKDLWLVGHELLRTQWTGPLPIKVEGRWTNEQPSRWRRRLDVMVKPGMSPGERARRSLALGNLIALQTQLATAGMEGVLVDAERYYRTVCDWARLNDIPRPEQYLIDPSSDAAKQAMQRKQQAQQMQQQAASQLQQQAIALENMRIAMEKYSTDVRAVMEKYKIDATTEQKEAELTIGLVKDREKADRELKAAVQPAAKVEGESGSADADDAAA